MINITYNRDNNSTLVELKDSIFAKKYLPLKVQFKNIISKEIAYEFELKDYTWISWNGAEFINDVLIYSSNGNLIHEYKWDVTINGDFIEKALWFYLKGRQSQGIKSNGLVIGAHDGTSGHWIYPTKSNLTNVTLVDGGNKQFQDLTKNYKNDNNVKLLNSVVTTDGSDVVWFYGGKGYADTIIKENIEFLNKFSYDENHYLYIDKINESIRTSVSLNSLMETENYDWLHLDVEGIDGDLILSLKQKPNIIIYENINLSKETKNILDEWFLINSYELKECTGNTIAIKKYDTF